MSHETEEQLLELARGAAAGDAPSPFETRRALHELNRALDQDSRFQRRAIRPRRVALIAVAAAFSGAAIAATVAYNLSDAAPEPRSRAPARRIAEPPPPAPPPAVVEVLPDPEPPPPPAPAPTRLVRRPAAPPTPPAPAIEPQLGPCAPGWVEVAAARRDEGRSAAAAEAWVNALCGPGARVSADALQAMVRAGVVDSHEVTELIDAAPRAADSVEGRRLPCAFGLRYDGSEAVIDRCEAFFERHPSHPAVRELALAVGVVAERNRLDERALAAYDRAISLGAGSVVAAPALLRRAQLHLRRGNEAAARADLQLYLNARPDAAQRGAVRALREQLGL